MTPFPIDTGALLQIWAVFSTPNLNLNPDLNLNLCLEIEIKIEIRAGCPKTGMHPGCFETSH
jgi:hypothetical protein